MVTWVCGLDSRGGAAEQRLSCHLLRTGVRRKSQGLRSGEEGSEQACGPEGDSSAASEDGGFSLAPECYLRCQLNHESVRQTPLATSSPEVGHKKQPSKPTVLQ
jgi:hypothetical protein